MDITMIMMIVWLSVFAIALIAELVTDALVSIWFSASALITLALSFIPGLDWWIQIIIFIVLSIVIMIILRPILNKMQLRNKSETNIDNIIKQKGVIIKKVDKLNYGQVKIHDVIWTAIPVEGELELEIDDVVEVVGVDGNKLIVKKVLQEEKQ